MKKLFYTFLLLALFTGCDQGANKVENALDKGLASGEWTVNATAGGYPNDESFKNFQYLFDNLNPNQVISVELTSSDIEVVYALYDPLGQLIDRSYPGKSLLKEFTINPGMHHLVITAERRAIGKFNVKVSGTKDGLKPISFNTLNSDTQNWGPLGGGSYLKTFRNHFYTFDLTDDNTAIDVELQSADTDVVLCLYNDLGTLVDIHRGNRYEYILFKKAKKGTYTLMIGTDTRGNIGNYLFNVFGKVQNLKRIESRQESLTGTWLPGKNAEVGHTYSFDLISTSNSPIDVALSSADLNVTMILQDGSRNDMTQVSGSAINKSLFYVSKDLPKGKYHVFVRPAGAQTSSSQGGNYTLTLTGQFANLKKL